MSVTVRKGDPRSPEGTALLRASHDYLSSLYPPEHNHYLSIDALCAPDITFLLAEAEGRTTGCVALKAFDGYGEIKSMFGCSLHPGQQGRLGRALAERGLFAARRIVLLVAGRALGQLGIARFSIVHDDPAFPGCDIASISPAGLPAQGLA